MVWRAVTDEQWALIKEQLPRRKRRVQEGRPPVLRGHSLDLMGGRPVERVTRKVWFEAYRPPPIKGMGRIGRVMSPMASLA